MKDPTRAPFYAAMYHGLCDTARKHGYALAIHGSVTQDLDLIAVPWIENPSTPQQVMEALRDHIGAMTTVPVDGYEECSRKPHGRLAWNLYLAHGAKVDLSVMPTLETEYPGCTGDPANCPENEGYGCCKSNTKVS